MSGTSSNLQIKNDTFNIPKLLVQVDRKYTSPLISTLTHGTPSADPTADGYFDWANPMLTLFTRDMTQNILDRNPVIVLQRYLPEARNSYKSANYLVSKVKRWVVPGNSSFNGEGINAGNSNTNSYGVPRAEVPNFIPMQIISEGYNHHYKYELPVSLFTSDRNVGNLLSQLNRAILAEEWNDSVRYSQHKSKRCYNMLFKLSLGVPNPDFELDKSRNPYLIGEGQTIIVSPRLQTFDDGSGLLEYYISWNVRVRE